MSMVGDLEQDRVGPHKISSHCSEGMQLKAYLIKSLNFPFNIFRPQLKMQKVKPCARVGLVYSFLFKLMLAFHFFCTNKRNETKKIRRLHFLGYSGKCFR